jgi:cytochrome c oxidase cbb3-type subunit I/II
VNDLNAQAEQIAKTLAESGIEVKKEREIIALIAYLQRLGTDIQVEE